MSLHSLIPLSWVIILGLSWLIIAKKEAFVTRIFGLLYPIRDNQGHTISGPSWKWPNGHTIDKFLHGRERSREWRVYGSVYRIWSCNIPEIVITTPEDVRAFHLDSDLHNKSASSNGGWFFHQLLGDCMGLTNGSRWKRLRSEFSHVFTYGETLHMSASISKYAHNYVRAMMPAIQAAEFTIHVSSTFMKFPFFCTADALYGPMTEDEKSKLWLIGQQSLALMRYVLLGGIYRFRISQIFCSGATKELSAFQKEWSAFNNRMYQSRRSRFPAPPIVSAWKPVTEGKLLESEVLQTLITLLAENEDQQRKLRDEIRNKGVNKNISLNDYCNSKDTFLRACYLESLRLRPFTVFSIPESSPSEKTLGGFRIPKNTSVVVDALEINVNNLFWGKDSQAFNPERFNNIKQADLRYNLFAFGFGTRKCLGQYFAEAMIKIFVIYLLDQYELRLPLSERRNGEYKVDSSTWVPISNVKLVLEKLK